jgi:ABC-type dipeptide/oligopeptide/nickel transport system permease subunit
VRHLSTRRDKIAFEIKRLKNFMKIFTRNRRGMLGIIILLLFTILAIAAPLITPYSPIEIPAHPSRPLVADKFTKPFWYKYLPLGEQTSENVEPIRDPDFTTEASLEEFDFTASVIGQSGVSNPQFVSDFGYNEKGCTKIVFQREATENHFGLVTANITKLFNWPYSRSASRFLGVVAIWVDTSEYVPVTVNVILEKDGGERRLDWWNQTFDTSGATWVLPDPMIDSNVQKSWLKEKFGDDWMYPQEVMFSEPANYKYGVEIMFNDTQSPTGEDVEATVYIDDLNIQVFGNSFGILGTDQHGRDILTQLLYGARISLLVGILSAVFSTAVGLIVGLVAGYMGKFVDQILMRFTDMLLVIPDTPLYIVLMAVLRPSIWNLILLITVIGWTGFARIVRSQVLSLRERPFIEAAKAVGAGKFRIILRHITPNVMNLVYVTLATSVPYAIVSEAWLSWLGLYDPTVMTWGRMLHDAQSAALGIKMWWWIIPPGITIALISLSFILLGYALDEILNPKLRKRY